jgi:hypothetical protein
VAFKCSFSISLAVARAIDAVNAHSLPRHELCCRLPDAARRPDDRYIIRRDGKIVHRPVHYLPLQALPSEQLDHASLDLVTLRQNSLAVSFEVVDV